MKLNERQRKFVLYYEGNATEAATKAGYSEKTAAVKGAKLLTMDKIQKALQEKHVQQDSKHIADVEERRRILTEIAREGDRKTAVKALDVLNKMDAVYVQKHEVRNFGEKTDDEVLQDVIADLRQRGYKVIPPK